MAWKTRSNDAWDWLGREVAEFGFRWLIGLAVAGVSGGWFGIRYWNMKCEVAELKKRLDRAFPSIVLGAGATYNVVEGDHHVHYHLNGPAEFLQPKPKVDRVIPLHVEFPEAIAVGEAFQPVLTKVGSTVEVHRSKDHGR